VNEEALAQWGLPLQKQTNKQILHKNVAFAKKADNREIFVLTLKMLRVEKGKSVPLQARGAQRVPGS